MKQILQALDNKQFRTTVFEEEEKKNDILYFLRFLPGSIFLTAGERGRAPKHSSVTELRRQILKSNAAKVTGCGWLEYCIGKALQMTSLKFVGRFTVGPWAGCKQPYATRNTKGSSSGSIPEGDMDL